MGAWGVGLYASDFARDLRPMVGTLARLPVDGDRLTELACERFAETARNPRDEDHTIFWLVLADQCIKRHIDAPEARRRALAIIDTGADLEVHRELGMTERDLGKRAAMLEALRPTLAAPVDRHATPRRSAPAPAVRDGAGRLPDLPDEPGQGYQLVFPVPRGRPPLPPGWMGRRRGVRIGPRLRLPGLVLASAS